MAQTFFPIDPPVDVTHAVDAVWTEIDVSAQIPAGATGVILHVVNNNVAALDYGLRKKGSGDDHANRDTGPFEHFWAAIGVDGSRIFEAYLEIAADFELWLVGYTMAGVTFFDNGVHQDGPGALWADWDLSVSCPGAVGVILELTGRSISYGAQCKGSGDNRTAKGNHYFAIVKCDASQVIEIYGSAVFIDFWCVGYITDGVTLFTDLPDYSLGVTGIYVDMDISGDCPNSVMAFIQVYDTGTGFVYALKKKGSAEDLVHDAWGLLEGFVEVDAAHILEGKIVNVATDFFLTGSADSDGVPAAPAGGSMAAKMIGHKMV